MNELREYFEHNEKRLINKSNNYFDVNDSYFRLKIIELLCNKNLKFKINEAHIEDLNNIYPRPL